MEFIVEQAEGAGLISTKRMFGVYCMYCDGKPVGFICEDQVLIKPTDAGRAYIGDVVETELFPGSKLWFSITDRFEDREWFAELVRVTASALPPPKPRKPRSVKKNGPKKYLIEDEEPEGSVTPSS